MGADSQFFISNAIQFFKLGFGLKQVSVVPTTANGAVAVILKQFISLS